MRADLFLVRRGYAQSRESAKKSIEAGLCSIDGEKILKPSSEIDENTEHTVSCENSIPYVGRGGLKLEAALDAFRVNPSGLTCADIGASTGGFTDCLLKRGAVKVYAIDSGHGQLNPKLSEDKRVVSVEGLNARYLSYSDVNEKCGLAVMDVSFISQTLILPNLPEILTDDGLCITLIKPQFEAGRASVGKGGIVKNPKDRRASCEKVANAAASCGLYMSGLIRSPIAGGDGNVEYLALFTKKFKEDYSIFLRETVF